jgi:hypothetical protein
VIHRRRDRVIQYARSVPFELCALDVSREPQQKSISLPKLHIMAVNGLLRVLQCLVVIGAIDRIGWAYKLASLFHSIDAV